MIRTQIYLPSSVHKALHRIGKERKVSLAEVIRNIVDQYLKTDRKSGATGLLALSKLKISGGPKDLSSNLDRYLYEDEG